MTGYSADYVKEKLSKELQPEHFVSLIEKFFILNLLLYIMTYIIKINYFHLN